MFIAGVAMAAAVETAVAVATARSDGGRRLLSRGTTLTMAIVRAVKR